MISEKGQYRIVNEVFLFAIGILIAIFIMMSFQDLEKKTEEYAAADQLNSISNAVFTGIIKVAGDNSTIRLRIPNDGGKYSISARDGNLIVKLTDNPADNVTRFLNMEEYIIIGDVSAEYVEISSLGNHITIRGSI
ncbi:MAG: hypothetical protein HZB67_04075 [Candidatus Aenigmarchaeota archaeon]|nr:hypothetical protein [Candidatus Aenigmarchaeota archaeon]